MPTAVAVNDARVAHFSPPEPVLFAPPDFNLLNPPGYPETLTIFVHARWRMVAVDEATARGPKWQDPADFQRWLAALPDVPENPGEGSVGTRGARTAHLLLRPGQTPRVGWSSYQKIFGDTETPVRLSPTQREAVEQFQVLRSVDLAILASKEMPRDDATRVRRIVLLGLPAQLAEAPEHTAARKFRWHVQQKLDWHAWKLEVRPCVPNRNPAAYLSGCYLAPILYSPSLPAGRVPAAPSALATGTNESRLLTEMGEALQLRDSARMAQIFAGMITHVQSQQTVAQVGPDLTEGPTDDGGEEDAEALDGAEPAPAVRSRRGRGR